MKHFLFCVALCIVASPVSAQVYRCVVNDKVTISTQPCPAGAAVTEFKPEPGAAEREAAAKKAADEEVVRMKEKISLMERERFEREAALDVARREQEIRSAGSLPANEPVRDEGVVERTVILPVAPPLYNNPNYYPNHPGMPGASNQMPPPRHPNQPSSSGGRVGKKSGNEPTGAFRPGMKVEPEKERATPVTPGRAASAKAPPGKTGKP